MEFSSSPSTSTPAVTLVAEGVGRDDTKAVSQITARVEVAWRWAG